LINLGIAPPLGWLASRLLPPELATGVIIATVVPCTLAAATVWTRRAGGNDAVAILVTMITNLACFLVVPAWLSVLIGDAANTAAEVNLGVMVQQLALLVVAPIVVAQLLRQWQPLAGWAGRRKIALSVLAQFGILSFVFAGAVRCGEELQRATSGQALSVGNLAMMILLVVVIHLLLLSLGLGAASLLRMSRPDAIAVGIAGSQKTIMVGLHVAVQIAPLAILPMVSYHAAQLLLDTVIADWLRERTPQVSDARD
jgi:solute carrier family 10 (sodium/bile acid cotransporter), member 7